ncbi:hypothetical protein NDU88_009324 [Pleurodeles waltl]|uniref:Uncharacterized protein n=1 Tax=Pleurodeles waltl TaxID=8319 RepID=A0AAV7RUX0_PLEWA|nr:hypothetical protein NDU88_009324 [Pleurodeles waltl]
MRCPVWAAHIVSALKAIARGARPGHERRWPLKSRAPCRGGPRRRQRLCGGRKITLTHVETPPQPPSSRPEPQQLVAKTLPAGSASRRKNGLQGGRSRVSSARKSALLRRRNPVRETPRSRPAPRTSDIMRRPAQSTRELTVHNIERGPTAGEEPRPRVESGDGLPTIAATGAAGTTLRT